MGRIKKEIIITDDNRDKDKKFMITELPASKTEAFSMLMIENLSKIDPDTIKKLQDIAKKQSNTQALASIDTSELDPRLASILYLGIDKYLFETLIHITSVASITITEQNADQYIEEVSTRLKLKEEFMGLHMGFFQKGNT